MNILVACEHHPVSPARFMVEAFQTIEGIDVRHIGTDKGGETGYSTAPRKDHAWKSQGHYNETWSDWRPDLVIYLDTVFSAYHHAVYHDAPHVWYHIEGLMDNTMPGMTHYFHATSYGPNWETMPEKMTWLPPAYAPAVHTPSAIPWYERRYDVCLVGRPGGKRMAYMRRLREAGLTVFHAYGLIYEDYAYAYHNARMSLVEHEHGIVPMRTFETAAMGNLVYSEWFSDYDKLGVEGVAAIPDDLEAVGQYALHLLSQEELCQEMIAQSMRWVRPHTYEARARTIIEWYEQKYATITKRQKE